MKIVIVTFIVVSLITVGCYSTAPVQYSRVESSESKASSAPAVSQQTPPAEQMTRLPPRPTPLPAPSRSPSSEAPTIATLPDRTTETLRLPQTIERPNMPMVPPRASTRAPQSSSPQQTSEDWVASLRQANMVLTVPEIANINEDVRVELLLHLEKAITELQRVVTERGTQYTDTVKVSRVVEVKLTAPAFDVNPITPTRQILQNTETNTWKWTLRPKNAGKHLIDITVIAVVEAEGARVENTLLTYKRQVQIEITTRQLLSQWFSQYWQWLATTIVIPLLLWWFKSRRKPASST